MRRGTQAAIIFGEYLYKLRTDAGLTMRELGARVGVPAATISQTEKGQRALKEPKLSAWADGLGINQKTLNYHWRRVQIAYPDGPIVRRREKSITPKSLEILILDLTGPERNRVCGYIDALLENRKYNS